MPCPEPTLAFWWIGTRQQQGRACLTITQLPRLTVLDPRSLSQEQLAQAEAIFERFNYSKYQKPKGIRRCNLPNLFSKKSAR